MDIEYVDFINEYYEQAKIVYSDMKRETGEDYILHPINVAYILAELKMDPVTIGCALIHEAITLNKMTYEEIEEMFGSESAIIVSSVTKISNLKQTFKINNPEKYRRIIVGLSENPATLFIKFADRLHNLRTLKVHDKEHQKYIVDETQNIYIPIAHRLGMKKMKSEMEDLVDMSFCEHQIISNSTMSWWAAELNRNPRKVCIIPSEQNWFGPDNHLSVKDLYREEFVQIKY